MNRVFCKGIVLVLLGLFSTSLVGNEGDFIRRRMRDRMPEIEDLKLAGKLGEDNRGFLQARAPLSEVQKSLIADENEDRKKIYFIIGIKAELKVEIVGMHRASQIAVRSIDGVWLQEEEGAWYRKGTGERVIPEEKGRKKRRRKWRE